MFDILSSNIDILAKWYDVILISFDNGNKITARYIQSKLWLLVFIFLIHMVFRVCIDLTHKKFSLISVKIERSKVLSIISTDIKDNMENSDINRNNNDLNINYTQNEDDNQDNEEYLRVSIMTNGTNTIHGSIAMS